jgi:hypothetical protein
LISTPEESDMSAQTVNWDSTDWDPVREGMERKTFTGEGASLALHRISPGHALLLHSHAAVKLAVKRLIGAGEGDDA